MLKIELLYHLLLGITTLYLILVCRGKYFKTKVLLGGIAGLFLAAIYAVVLGDMTGIKMEALTDMTDEYKPIWLFSSFRLLGGGLFIEGPIFLFGCALWILTDRSRVWKDRLKRSSFLLALTALAIGIGIEAFFIEPQALQIRKLEISSDRIDRPTRIVLMSDIETDRINSYNRRILKTMTDQKPDLYLFGGDYIQYSRSSLIEEGSLLAAYEPTLPKGRARDLRREFNALLKEFSFSAPFGARAVSGSRRDLRFDPMLFDGTGIELQKETATVPVGNEIYLTLLSPEDSSFSNKNEYLTPEQQKENRFHIILGHIPDFVMAYPNADLVLAGHTHGGQFQIPFFGPIATGTKRLPRTWASGHRFIIQPNGSSKFDLIVSNGSNVDGGGSPRMRFCCRPDIWVIDLLPKKGNKFESK